MRRFAILFLLLLATTHCVLSVFFVNRSYLDLPRYAAGLDHLPFQRRLLMIPVLRWAQASPWLQRAAARFARFNPGYEPMSAAKLACVLLGVAAIVALGLLSMARARRLGVRHDWLVWALLLGILYASYAARFEQALWYPYDLPHIGWFGAATLLLLCDQPWAFLACFAVDAVLRETAVFLLPVGLAMYPRSRRWQATAAAAAVVWGAVRWLAWRLYPNNLNQPNAVPWYRMGAPWHWPQIASIVGFLWIPVLLQRGSLSQPQRAALYAASGCMVVTFFFATWNESRAWSEWSVLFAVLAAVELEGGLARGAATA
jgi:hypothetical protein